MRRRSIWTAAAAASAVLIPAAFSIFSGISVNALGDLSPRLERWALIASAATLIILVFVNIGEQRNASPEVPEHDLTVVARRLANLVEREWSEEESRRLRGYPGKMSVRWIAADANLFPVWSEVERLAGSGSGPAASTLWASDAGGLAGEGDELADVLDRVPTGRLVVLGEGGSGKSILLLRLTLDLLARRDPTGPVPVLLPMASWDPQQNLYDWIEHRLITDHDDLAVREHHGVPGTLAAALLRKDMILPIFDGLDEMTGANRSLAIGKIGEAMPIQRLVIAARERHYRAAVRPPGGFARDLIGAVGVTLCPLDLSDVAAYLSDAGGRSDVVGRWDRVISEFAAVPPTPVAEALRSPLMVGLAQAAYNPRQAEPLDAMEFHPDELLVPTTYPTVAAIKFRLLDLLIPSVYRSARDGSRTSRWTERQAESWLTFLARHLQHRQGGSDIEWWSLRTSAPRPLVPLGTGLIAGLASWGWPFVGNGIGLLTAVLAGLVVRRLTATKGRLMRALVGGVLGGMAGVLVPLAVFGAGVNNSQLGSFVGGGVVLGIVVSPLGGFRAGFIGAFVGETTLAFYEYADAFQGAREALGSIGRHLLNGLGLGFAVAVAVVVAGSRFPARAMQWSWPRFSAGLAAGAIVAMVVGVQVGAASGLLAGLAAIAIGLATGVLDRAAGTDLEAAASPRAVLTRDRTTFVKSFLVVGLALGFGTGIPIALSRSAANGYTDGLAIGLGVGCANFVAAGVAFSFMQASWGSFAMTRCWLWATHRLPWPVMAFLADAHERQVLRQVGAVYQFRHIDLQRHLASKPSP